MEQPFQVEQYKLNMGISIGIPQYPEDGMDSDVLLQKVDVAMYVAKRNSLGFSIYELSQDKNSLSRLTVHGRLRDAITNNELSLHFQSIINLSTGKVHAFEVLTRWYNEELGQVFPDEFIPIAEQSGMIKQLSLWVVDTACRQLKRWGKYSQDIVISINLLSRFSGSKPPPSGGKRL